MVYPFNANRIKQLELDPTKKIEGYVWYNTVEKVYKTWVDDQLQIFMTDAIFSENIGEIVDEQLANKKFSFTFDDAYSVIIKHNKGTKFFNYNLFDTNENCEIQSSVEILNENEVQVDFVDPVTGYIFMYFN